jgi:hypothetical protein
LGEKWRVLPETELIRRLEDLLGPDGVRVLYR